MNKSNTKKSDKDLWATPWWVFNYAEQYFNIKFDLDACAMEHNTKVKKIHHAGTRHANSRLARALLLDESAL